tara:strand:+ start:100 stop:795 length:696 start_codon:yes stop_codon:yes gene_type:complete
MTTSKKITGLILLILVAGLLYAYMYKPSTQVQSGSEMVDEGISSQESEELLLEETGFSEEEAEVLTEEEPIIMTTAVVATNKGTFRIELFEDKAPNTVENFTKLASSGFYDGVKFHRVIKGFMIQGGDPLTKDDDQSDYWGTGGPGYTFDDEIYDGNDNAIGTISMANAGPNTNGSQFFINTAHNDFLNPKHTVFGRVVDGMETINAIENVDTSPNDRPIEAVVIESITLQ